MIWYKINDLPIDEVMTKKVLLACKGKFLNDRHYIVGGIYRTYESDASGFESTRVPIRNKKLSDDRWMHGVLEAPCPTDEILGWIYEEGLINDYEKYVDGR